MVKAKINQVRIFVLLFILFLPALFGLLRSGYFSMHDDLQIFRLYELDKCVQDGQFPCRWIPDGGFGYGYPMFNFYPPLPYYPAEALHLLGIDLFTSVEIMFGLSFVLSGFFMYLLTKEFFGDLAGVVAAVFYVYAPYHSLDVYVRGAMNEAWGLVWFPLIFLYIYRLIDQKKNIKKNLSLLALSVTALMLSHNPMTLIFAPVAASWSLFWLWQKKAWPKIKHLVYAILLAAGLAAFFFIPVIVESKAVHVESMMVGYFNYMAHYADLPQMFISRFWGYGGSVWGPNDNMAFPLGHLHWILASVVGVLALWKFFKDKKKRQLSLMIIGLMGISLVSLFLIHSRSIWFWQNIPLLYMVQFPWRLLALPIFIFSFLIGTFFVFIKSPKWQKIFAVVSIVAVIAWNMPFFHIDHPVMITEQEKLSGRLWELQVTGGIFDYLPKTAPRPPGEAGFTIPDYFEGNGGILDYQKGSNWLRFIANTSTEEAQVMLPLYGFPGMKIKVDGQKVDYQTDEELGRILVDVSQGQSLVEAKLYRTPVRLLAELLTILSLIVLLKINFSHERKSTH